MAWFFVTPIIYPASKVLNHESLSPALLNLYFFNPMTALIQVYRQIFLGTPSPGLPIWPGFVGIGMIFLAGIYTFLRLDPRFADEL